AEARRLHGKEVRHRPSRFLREIPKDCIEDTRIKTKVSRMIPLNTSQKVIASSQTTYIGQRVKHHQFGEGIILQHEGNGEHARIQVQFETAGTKWLIASFVEMPKCHTTL